MRFGARAAFLAAGAGACLLAAQASAQQEIQPRMGDPVPGLSAAEQARFLAGKVEFGRTLSAAEGLGPIMNDHSCASCHGRPRSGGFSTKVVTRFGRAATMSEPFDPLASLGGSLLQIDAIAPECREFVPPEANVQTKRLTPPVFGAGLVEAIRDREIVARQTFPPPGVSGRAHMVLPLEAPPSAPLRVGRFGWKAQVATVLSFSADASLNELGLTNRLVGAENAPNGNQALLALCDAVPDPEDGPDAEGFHRIDRQRDFQRFLAAPPQTPRGGTQGEKAFGGIGCVACHVSKPYLTRTVAEAALSGRSVRPFSDFLLHDMGSLGDGIVQGDASETEIRTAPLWGLRTRAEGALLHDGRATGGTPAQNLLSAITAHDGEAAPARDLFLALPAEIRDRLIGFLLSLGRAEFDYEGDNDVDALDWFFLEFDDQFTGPVPTFQPDDPGSTADFDQDGDFDLRDFAVFQRAFTGDEVGFTPEDVEERIRRVREGGRQAFAKEWGAVRPDDRLRPVSVTSRTPGSSP